MPAIETLLSTTRSCWCSTRSTFVPRRRWFPLVAADGAMGQLDYGSAHTAAHTPHGTPLSSLLLPAGGSSRAGDNATRVKAVRHEITPEGVRSRGVLFVAPD